MSRWIFERGEWVRYIGGLTISVWEQGGGWPWSVAVGRMGRFAIALGRLPEDCITLEVAQRKAEGAAREFLRTALADLDGDPQ